MATSMLPGLSQSQIPQPQYDYPSTSGQGQERTADAPMPGKPDDVRKEQGLNDDLKQALMRVRRSFKEKWYTVRRKIIRRCLKAYEFFKGNQFIAFDPENFQWFDPIEAALEGQEEPEDLDMYKFTNNIYKMLTEGFVAALSAETPRTEFFPQDAENPDDIETAQNASTVEEILERKNKIKTLHKECLLYLWMTGCYFTYNRFVVDEDRWGTKKMPDIQPVEQKVTPDTYVCPNCGHEQGEDVSGMALLAMPRCENCGQELSSNDFYPGESMTVPTQVGELDVPSGMVTSNIYSPMNVDAAPYCNELRHTPLLDLEEEVDIAAMRAAYPDAWDELKMSTVGNAIEGELERVARQHIWSALGGRNNMTGEIMPTLSRCWIQPWAFNTLDDKNLALQLRQLYPKGALLVTAGDTFLEARPEKLTDHWTWCGTEHGFGLYPPAIGDAAIEVQERVNDVANTIHEHMDRNASPTLLADEDVVNTKALSGKPMPPGTVTGVKRKAAMQQRPLSDFIFQPKFEIDANIYDYGDKLVYLAQLLSGVMPQVFGGSGDPHIETASGQKQQLNTALGRLMLFWDQVREEHAARALINVKLAVENMSGQLADTVSDGSEGFINRVANLDNMRGEFSAHPETDQGFPQTFAEIRDRITEFVGMAENNVYVQAMLEEPTNQKIVAMYTLPGNMVIPGDAMRNKCLQIINVLVKEGPVPGINPFTGKPMMMPSRPPDKDFDDMATIAKLVKEYAQEHWKLMYTQPEGFENLRAYYQIAETIVSMQAAQQQAAVIAQKEQMSPTQPGQPGGQQNGAPQ